MYIGHNIPVQIPWLLKSRKGCSTFYDILNTSFEIIKTRSMLNWEKQLSLNILNEQWKIIHKTKMVPISFVS